MEKENNKGLKVLVFILFFVLICFCGVGYYGYTEYQQLKNDNKELKSKIQDQNKQIENNENQDAQTNNYTVENDKHVYGKDGSASVYAINGAMSLTSSNGTNNLNINENDVNKVVVKESAQGVLTYVVMKSGSVIRFYDGSSFERKNAFVNYKVKDLIINCTEGEAGSCSSRTYTLTLLDGSSKTVSSDE